MKFIISLIILLVGLNFDLQAQEKQKDSTLVISEKDAIAKNPTTADTVDTSNRFKADGIAAVIGDYLILDSDITKMQEDVKAQGMSLKDVTPCQLAGRLMENKLLAHQAKQDTTIMITEAEINGQTDQQLARMKEQLGSTQRLLEFYRKESEEDLRDELIEINKEQILASRMQDKVIESVEITPEEVHAFFEDIPKDERPKFGDEVEIAQLVIKPEVPREEEQKVVDQLTDMRTDIVENGASFATKAVLYSEDGSSSKGGKITITRDAPYDKDFKQVAFSLQEGEVSQPFKSSFGYHIIQLDKIRGQELDIRHVILIPKPTQETIKKAKAKIDSIRTQIFDGKISFDKAARTMSDQEETRGDGGKLINPETGDTRFELTKIDPLIYDQVVNLEEGEISTTLTDQTRTGQKFFKIVTVTNRYPEHIADYAKDYSKIKELALREKQYKAIEKWQKEKIEETYVKINGKYRDCTFQSNWLKDL